MAGFAAAAPVFTPTIAVNATFVSVAWIAVLLRGFTRVTVVKVFHSEDALMVAAAASFTVYCAVAIQVCRLVNRGEGESIPLGPLLEALKLLIVAECAYLLTLLVLKISIGLFFLRVSAKRWQRVVIWVAIGLSTAISIVLFFFDIFVCGVSSSMLDFLETKLAGRCASDAAVLGMNYTHGGATALTDWIFILMPFFILRKSSMHHRDKMIAGSLMVFASISGIASLIRLKYIPSLTVSTTRFFAEASSIVIWSCVEQGVGIIAGCIMCLRPLFRRYFPSLARVVYSISPVHINEPNCKPYDIRDCMGSTTKPEDSRQSQFELQDSPKSYNPGSHNKRRSQSWLLNANPVLDSSRFGAQDLNVESAMLSVPEPVKLTGSSQMLPLDIFVGSGNARASHCSEMSEFQRKV